MTIPRPEHPRPQFVRDTWANLNGIWDFLFDFGNSGMDREFWKDEAFDGAMKDSRMPTSITVPFCPESRLSGIGYTDWIAAVWYRRTFSLNEAQTAGRVLLHFGAVDYHSVVWINGRKAGEHKGGYSSFSFDITAFVNQGENTVTVYAEDDNRSGKQPVGKQSTKYQSHACSYTRTTGIWQTVWLEFTPKNAISYAKITPYVPARAALIDVEVTGGASVTAEAFYDGRLVGKASAKPVYGLAHLALQLGELHLWDAGQPELYDLVLTLDGADTVKSYFGMRSVELDKNGLRLNGRPVFMRTVLDQGFNPEGVYTAPDDEFLRRDIELSMDLGMNGARLHQRVFEERFLYWADHLGYLVWGEYADGHRLNDADGIANFLPEWMETVRRDYSHPAIIGWCPENESYWCHDVNPICQTAYYDVTKAMDPTRPVIDASGGVHFKTDMFDIHDYEQDPVRLKASLDKMLEDPMYAHNPIHQEQLRLHVYEGQPYWISEYGGTFWNPDEPGGWGYGNAPKTEEEFAARYAGLTGVLLDNPRICGFCYTQLTDIEQEQNGLYKYDRSRKFSDAVYDAIREANVRRAAMETEEESAE
ncbi:MAG: beta-galactosidase [Ruminococcaceae bacterium]|jgi:beta-galactosidase/beta-glucuronidase|nr:beta-galactosidase [Oscillospiraceae bacterium]